MLTERVTTLRDESFNADPHISGERARLMTEFYQSDAFQNRSSIVVARARSFHYLVANRTIYIGDRELIVGERGPAPKATPTYPELCCHTLDDFSVMNTRERTPFAVADDVLELYSDVVIPFWLNEEQRTIRQQLFGMLCSNAVEKTTWEKALDGGVFTEFMEQRSPGHAILDDKIYKRGFQEVKEEIIELRGQLQRSEEGDNFNAKIAQYDAMEIACEAIILLAERHAEEAERLSQQTEDPLRRAELLEIARICRKVPAKKPETFREALQAYWFVHLGVITELNTWDSFNPGRLDLHLQPFYEQEIAAGTLTREEAEELLMCFWIKFNNQPAPPKVGITEEQSGTYTDFALINVGGLNAEGEDAVCEMTYLILDVVEQMRFIQPSACVQVSAKNPDKFLRRVCEVVRVGFGQPSIFNADVIQDEMFHAGKTPEDGLLGGPSGCVTISAFGKESCTLTGYMNWPKILEITLNGGKDPRTGVRVGIESGDPRTFKTFDELLIAYERQLKYFLDIKIAANNRIERLYAEKMPSPWMSVLMDDCIARGMDYHDGGARYNTTYIQGVGMGTLVDSLTAIKYHVFDAKTVSMEQLLGAVAADFNENEEQRILRARLVNKTPKYGNDDPQADEIAAAVFTLYYRNLDGRKNTKGGFYCVNLLPTTVHTYFGSITGTTPNGRRAGETLSEGISPSQGVDVEGPTAVIRSAAKIDHSKTGGTLLNQRFLPQVLEGEGLDKLASLVRTYFRLGGHHIQFNIHNTETLKEAQANPEKHRDLIVRVAGYSDYFVDVGQELQNEIISRTTHGEI